MALNLFSLGGKPKAAKNDIYLFNTLGGKKELFKPLHDLEVRMYNCGPTVYDFPTIGNFRAYVFADSLKRMFEINGYKVKQVINITDVGHLSGDNLGDASAGEDKIEKAARSSSRTAKEIADFYTEDFLASLKKLNVDTSDTIFPKATEHILEQIALIKTLEEKGYTYRTSDGIYFDTSLFKDYGKLGNINIQGLKEGSRIEINPERKHPTDFALWKFSKPEEHRQQEWESPWGRGFPGWHIECSAMSMKYLGKTFDVHTGGIDHIPVHHNNEIAQSEAATNRKFVDYWLHNAFLTINGKRVGKSEGNAILLKDLEAKGFAPLSYRYWLLTAHYRTPVNFTWEALEGAQTAYARLVKTFAALGETAGKIPKDYSERFMTAISDDLDSPKAIAAVWDMVSDGKVSNEDKRAALIEFDKFLGLRLSEPETLKVFATETIPISDLPPEIRKKVEAREEARKSKDWVKADSLRKEIEASGYILEDSAEGPKISKK